MTHPTITWDWVAAQEFPKIHEIVQGRDGIEQQPERRLQRLTYELDNNPNAINARDKSGRTALCWATAQGKLPEMELLIARGSNTNQMDVNGRTTILHAVDSHNEDVLSAILKAGGDPNPRVPRRLCRSSPLIAASFGGLVGMVRLLLRFGAELNACNPEGWTALQQAASVQNVECVKTLLEFGADPVETSENGQSALTIAMIRNSHPVLELFLHHMGSSRLEGLRLIPIVAQHADARTMSILTASPLLANQAPLDEGDLSAARATLRSRADYDTRLGNAFENLISLIGREISE